MARKYSVNGKTVNETGTRKVSVGGVTVNETTAAAAGGATIPVIAKHLRNVRIQ